MTPRFKIIDWAGNDKLTHQTFETFEDAWSFIHEYFADLDDNEFEIELGEYAVVEISKARSYDST